MSELNRRPFRVADGVTVRGVPASEVNQFIADNEPEYQADWDREVANAEADAAYEDWLAQQHTWDDTGEPLTDQEYEEAQSELDDVWSLRDEAENTL